MNRSYLLRTGQMTLPVLKRTPTTYSCSEHSVLAKLESSSMVVEDLAEADKGEVINYQAGVEYPLGARVMINGVECEVVRDTFAMGCGICGNSTCAFYKAGCTTCRKCSSIERSDRTSIYYKPV